MSEGSSGQYVCRGLICSEAFQAIQAGRPHTGSVRPSHQARRPSLALNKKCVDSLASHKSIHERWTKSFFDTNCYNLVVPGGNKNFKKSNCFNKHHNCVRTSRIFVHLFASLQAYNVKLPKALRSFRKGLSTGLGIFFLFLALYTVGKNFAPGALALLLKEKIQASWNYHTTSRNSN